MIELHLRYEKYNPISGTSHYHDFIILQLGYDSPWRLLRKRSWGFEPVIKPDGRFGSELLARVTLDYIENEKGFHKCSEHYAE